MTATVPPRLLGPRMAVWASFPFDNRPLTPAGSGTAVPADWDWAMGQWNRVAQAGPVVRVVVVDQPYSLLDLTTTVGLDRRAEASAKFGACRAVDQLLFGRVYAGGGKLPLGGGGQKFDDPLRPGHQVPGIADQVEAWRKLYGDGIDGIYVDSGPTDCTDPTVPGAEIAIPGNYRAYAAHIRGRRYKLFLQAAQYPDSQPQTPWLRDLNADFLELWEAGVSPYTLKFQARDACNPDRPTAAPAWWDPGPDLRWSRVHVINDCRNAETMRTVANLAITSRGAGTIWITLPRQDPNLGAVYDVLPPYWADEVAVFESFVRRDEQAAKDLKDGKDEPDQAQKDATDAKSLADAAAKEVKDAKDDPDADEKETADTKERKDNKDIPDKTKEDPETSKDEAKDTKEDKDEQAFKDARDTPPVFLKDSELTFKVIEVAGLVEPAAREPGAGAATGGDPELDDLDRIAIGRTFIRAEERPAVGERIVADDPEPDREG